MGKSIPRNSPRFKYDKDGRVHHVGRARCNLQEILRSVVMMRAQSVEDADLLAQHTWSSKTQIRGYSHVETRAAEIECRLEMAAEAENLLMGQASGWQIPLMS